MTTDQYTELLEYLGHQFGLIDARFTSIEQRLDAVEQRLDALETRVTVLEVTVEPGRDYMRVLAEGIATNRESMDARSANMDGWRDRADAAMAALHAHFPGLEARYDRFEARFGDVIAEVRASFAGLDGRVTLQEKPSPN